MKSDSQRSSSESWIFQNENISVSNVAIEYIYFDNKSPDRLLLSKGEITADMDHPESNYSAWYLSYHQLQHSAFSVLSKD